MRLTLSSLVKTWIFDLDGTLVLHNGHIDGKDILLPGVKEFFKKIPEEDYILILTARDEKFKVQIESFFKKENIRYNHIIYNIPVGERILFNDRKPSGLQMAYAVNLNRNHWCDLEVCIDNSL
jgi:NLI interacting factor-like phosphatase.